MDDRERAELIASDPQLTAGLLLDLGADEPDEPEPPLPPAEPPLDEESTPPRRRSEVTASGEQAALDERRVRVNEELVAEFGRALLRSWTGGTNDPRRRPAGAHDPTAEPRPGT